MKLLNGDTLAIPIYKMFDEMDDDVKVKLIEYLGWEKPVLEKAVDLIENEYSRENYNTVVHETRKKLLEKVKEEELEYYANKIADRVEELKRERHNYFKIYHYMRDRARDLGIRLDNIPDTDPIDFDYRHELAKMIQEELKNNITKKAQQCPKST